MIFAITRLEKVYYGQWSSKIIAIIECNTVEEVEKVCEKLNNRSQDPDLDYDYEEFHIEKLEEFIERKNLKV